MTGTASPATPSATPAAVVERADERLAAFRERQAGQQQFTESGEPVAPSPIESRAATPTPEPAPEPEMPKLRVDPRDAIAARSRAARAARNPDGFTAPADRFNIPAGIPVEGDADDETARRLEEEEAAHRAETSGQGGQQQRQPAPRQEERRTPPTVRTPDGNYTLRVNNQNFTVSRDELLRYAEVEPSEAEGFSDLSLVRLAQKHIYASSEVERAKVEAKSIRQAQRTQPGHMPGEDEPSAEDQSNQLQPHGLHSLSDKALMEKVQFGDSDEALEAQQILTTRQFQRMSASDREARIDAEINSVINDFALNSADISQDDFLQGVHQTALTSLAVEEIAAKAPGITSSMVTQLKANPNLALRAYKAAMLDGLQVRPPAELFEAAANTVRTRFGGTTPQREVPRDNPPPAPTDRTVAKRGLIAQPRPESTSISGQQPVPRRASASDKIRASFGNRMNRG